MTPSIKTIAADIAQELREHPERWTQGAFARGENGRELHYFSDSAACRCLEGHVIYRAIAGVERMTHKAKVGQAAVTELGLACRAMGIFEYGGPANWNDQRGRTVADVIALCERVAGDPTPCPQCHEAGEHKAGCERGTEP